MSLLHIMHRFEEESIDFQVFLALTEDDMKELGLKMGDRKRVAMAQAYFTNQQVSSSGSGGCKTWYIYMHSSKKIVVLF